MKQKILGFISALVFWMLGLSYRYQLVFKNEEDKELYFKLINKKKPDKDTNAVLAFFHQDEFCLLPFYIGYKFALLVSLSKDGEIMTRATKHMGHIPVRGSSSRRAVAGLIAIIKKVKEGYTTAIAVDGPKGPIFKVKDGVIAISQKTQRPIIPVRVHAFKRKNFDKAWNKARVAYPFSKVQIIIGKIGMYEKEELENELVALSVD